MLPKRIKKNRMSVNNKLFLSIYVAICVTLIWVTFSGRVTDFMTKSVPLVNDIEE